MTALHTLYHPITATPFARANTCVERLPAPDLAPYVRCYWTTAPSAQHEGAKTLVIPDTCVDMIFRIDEGGRIRGTFCAMQDGAFVSTAGGAQRGGLFAIRLYPWAAALFAQESLCDTRNGSYEAGRHFPEIAKQVEAMLGRTGGFEARCMCADAILRACCDQAQASADLMNAMYAMLQSRGRRRIGEIAQTVCLSTRQLERVFEQRVGVGPKALSAMVRYQYLWREAAGNSVFSVQDAVYRYGYTDQAHLLRQFKAYHSLTLPQALAHARGENVAFLQDKHPGG